MTDAEKALWREVRDRRLSGHKFRRQVPVDKYVVDFLCEDGRLIVELDGGQHAVNAAGDAERSAVLKSYGYRVIRFWNNDVLTNMDGVKTRILEALEEG